VNIETFDEDIGDDINDCFHYGAEGVVLLIPNKISNNKLFVIKYSIS